MKSALGGGRQTVRSRGKKFATVGEEMSPRREKEVQVSPNHAAGGLFTNDVRLGPSIRTDFVCRSASHPAGAVATKPSRI
ncbi:predicted protein [Coccidioides posadasii str. Silveira]|uniref:Predicted protein n=1 Tax=Coccidioides posadasii (strain RMSCC 757 / Silveira) TaxID=443226 RepID=E9CSN2_COCPS|nr:predicted protein [Coccidioides posadasii str. Silveira]